MIIVASIFNPMGFFLYVYFGPGTQELHTPKHYRFTSTCPTEIRLVANKSHVTLLFSSRWKYALRILIALTFKFNHMGDNKKIEVCDVYSISVKN